MEEELGHLGVTLLVQLHLGSGGAASLVQTLIEVLGLASKVRPLPFCLGSGLSLGLQLLLHLLNSALELLDGLLDLGHQGLLVLQLGGNTGHLSILSANLGLKFLSGSLQIGNGLLHDLQFSLNLPPLLLQIAPGPLLLVNTALKLVQSRLQLLLDSHQVVHLVIGHLQVLGGLGRVLSNVLLLLVQLVNDLILVSNFVIESLDGVISSTLLLAQLLDDNLKISNVLLDGHSLQLKSLLVIGGINSCLLSLGKLLSGFSQSNLKISLLAGDGGLSLVVLAQVTLLSLYLLDESLLLLL